jgi:Flp pilus assembly pilin Flp
MKNFAQLFQNFVNEDNGQDLIEYALLGLGAVAAMKGLAGNVSTAFGNVGTALTSNI